MGRGAGGAEGGPRAARRARRARCCRRPTIAPPPRRGLADAEQAFRDGAGRAHRRRAGVPRRPSSANRTRAENLAAEAVADRADRRRRRGARARRAGARARHHGARGRRARARRGRAGVPRGRGASPRGRGRPAHGWARRPPVAAPRSRRSAAALVGRARARAAWTKASRTSRRGSPRLDEERERARGRHRADGRADLAARRAARRSSRRSGGRWSRRSRSSRTSSAGIERATTCSRPAGATSRRRPARASWRAHEGRAIGLLRDLVRVEPGLERALVAALGPLADAVVYDDGDRAARRRPRRATARSSRSRRADRSRSGSAASASLLSAVDAQPAARGIVSTVLRDVYLAATVDEAADKQARAPEARPSSPPTACWSGPP